MGISLGLVGLGSFGREFADLFLSHPLVDRIALCDLEPERIAAYAKKASWQAKLNERDVYNSLDESCRSDLDALVIITQPWLHAPQCIQAMEAGKHVYSAVPDRGESRRSMSRNYCPSLKTNLVPHRTPRNPSSNP